MWPWRPSVLETGVMDNVKSTSDTGPTAAVREAAIGTVPEYWSVLKLGEMVSIKGGKRLPKGHSFALGPTAYPYIRVVDFKDGSVRTSDLKFLTEEDHRLLSRYTISDSDVYISIAGTIGLVGRVPSELHGAHLTENAARLVVSESAQLDPSFCVAFLHSNYGQSQIRAQTTKTSQPKLALTRIRDIIIPVPPLPEQRSIAGILHGITKAKRATGKVIAATRELKHSLVRHLFTYGPVAVEAAGGVEVQDTAIGPMPKHWRVGKLHEFGRS
jgi:type I restriction enzyme, S subunit